MDNVLEILRYSVTIHGNGWKENSDRCFSMQDVLEYITDEMSWCDNNECILSSEITVYICGTDDLVAHKETDEAMEDFIVELTQASKILNEKEKRGVLEWLQLFESKLKISRNVQYIYEECGE